MYIKGMSLSGDDQEEKHVSSQGQQAVLNT